MPYYRRNADADIRDVERLFLTNLDEQTYLQYVVACQRAGMQPAWCSCGQRAQHSCSMCSKRYTLPIAHCRDCKHLCSGTITVNDEDLPCTTDLAVSPQCAICEEHICVNEDCSESGTLQECGDCEKSFCASGDCGSDCDDCGEPVCQNCHFECEAHNQTLCRDCTIGCDYCSDLCCTECVCAGADCGVHICNDCFESGDHGACAICDARLCDDHELRCDICGDYVCQEHAQRCSVVVNNKKCRNIVCEHCEFSKCDICGIARGCNEHFSQCTGCEDTICGACAHSCPGCEKVFDAECLVEHQEYSPDCQKLGTLPAPVGSPTPTIKLGTRVQLVGTTLLGTVIKVSVGDKTTKYIVEWDNDTAGKHPREELQLPSAKRRRI